MTAGGFAELTTLPQDATVVFFGDSITDQRLYTTFVEAYVLTRFPDLQLRFVHSGWGGDTVRGGGGGPIDVRLQRDVFAYKPTVMTVMLGMNDGGYLPFSDELFQTYCAGYEHLVASVQQACPGVHLTLIQPSAYDDVTRPPVFPGGYNAVLARYGAFVAELAARVQTRVADLNMPVVALLHRANEIDPQNAPRIIGDRVHPDTAGHLILAQALLKAWDAPALVSNVTLDAEGAVESCENASVSEITHSQDNGSLTWTQADAALPFPLDFCDEVLMLATQASGFAEVLDRQMLTVTGLDPRNQYTLTVDGEPPVAVLTADELAAGVNLALLPTPMLRQSLEVLALTRQHAEVHQIRWRSIQVPFDGQEAFVDSQQRVLDALDTLEANLVAEQRRMARPQPHRFALTPHVRT